MNDREFFCQRHQTELPAFQRVLAALPLNQFEYRPHERSPSTLDLVWTLANEMAACSTIIDRGEVHWADVPAPGAGEAVKAFHANYEALDDCVQALEDQQWTRQSKFYVGGKLLTEPPLAGGLWDRFFGPSHCCRVPRPHLLSNSG